MAYNVRNSLFPPLTLFILSNVCHLKYLPSATTAAPIITYGEGTNDDVHLVHSFARLFVSCTLVAAGVHCTSTTLRAVYTRRVVGGGGHFRWTLEDSREAQADRQTDKWEVLCVALNTHIYEHYIFVLSTWLHQQKPFVILFFTSLCLWEQILSLSGARFIHCTVVLSKVVFMCVCWWSWPLPPLPSPPLAHPWEATFLLNRSIPVIICLGSWSALSVVFSSSFSAKASPPDES